MLATNAFIGLVAFEWAWAKVVRFRKPIPELEALVPAFRRQDAQQWRKWMFYPGALTIFFPRFLFTLLDACFIILLVKILLIGQPRDRPV